MTPYNHAINLLKNAASPAGFVASVNVETTAGLIRTRDAVIAGIAALLSNEPQLIEGFKNSLVTIFSNQHTAGFMPFSVSEEGVQYGGADVPSWAVLGLCLYTQSSGDGTLKKQYTEGVKKCIDMMQAWEYNGRHLMHVPQGSGWAAEYISHGYLLFEQLLRMWALEEAARLYGHTSWMEKAKQIRKTVAVTFWKEDRDDLYFKNMDRLMQDASTDYWQMGFNPSRVYTYFDQPANALALFLKMGTPEQQRAVSLFHEQLLQQAPGMLPCTYPSIIVNDTDFAGLSHNYTDQFRNYPGQWYNGGKWPVWNGFSVAALQAAGKEYAALHLQYRIEETCAAQQAAFPECVDATTGMLLGNTQCTCSAAGLIIGKKALEGKFFYLPQ